MSKKKDPNLEQLSFEFLNEAVGNINPQKLDLNQIEEVNKYFDKVETVINQKGSILETVLPPEFSENTSLEYNKNTIQEVPESRIPELSENTIQELTEEEETRRKREEEKIREIREKEHAYKYGNGNDEEGVPYWQR